MQIDLQDITAEGLATQLASNTPLTETIYSLYCLPASDDLNHRVVILTDHRLNGGLDGHHREATEEMEVEDICELLLKVLVKQGERTGDVCFNCPPKASDYVLEYRDSGFRVARPLAVHPVHSGSPRAA